MLSKTHEINIIFLSDNLNMKKLISKGFTIIEFLVYITILAIVIIAMTGVASNVFQVGARTDAIQEVTHNGRFAMQKIGQAIKSADTIVFPETEGNLLILEFENEEKNPVIFDVFEKTLRIKQGGKEYIGLTTSKVNIDSIKFKKVSCSGLDSIKIEMDISFNNPKGLPEYDFNNFFTGAFTIGSLPRLGLQAQ